MELDLKAWKLIAALQLDARQPLKSLAVAAGLSIPATAERLRRLEAAGIIHGYSAHIAPALAGYPVRAIVGITVAQPGKRNFLSMLEQAPRVIECHHVSGADSYVMTVVATDLTDLEQFIADINAYGETRTSIVFSTPIERRGLVAPQNRHRKRSTKN